MSWDVALTFDGVVPVVVPWFQEGGTYPIGGSIFAEMSVTYNYGGLFRMAWPDNLHGPSALRLMLDGRTGEDTERQLDIAFQRLGTVRDEDYWAKTRGNAGYALFILHGWAKQYLDAIWEVT